MRTYTDLFAIYENTVPWQPAVPGEPDPVLDRPSEEKLEYFEAEKIARALQIDVLGQREDGVIEVYSEPLNRTVCFRGLDRMQYPTMLQYFGTPVKRTVSKTNEDQAPGMHPISDVRDAIGHLASKDILHDDTKLGAGCWPVSGDEDEPTGLILVNTNGALHYSDSDSIERITHPRHEGQLLSFESVGQPWFDFDHLSELLNEVSDPVFRAKVVTELADLFCCWRWRDQSTEPVVVAGLVLATWIQTIWTWRPRIDILGGSNTGKSMLCEALAGLFGDLAVSTSDASAAGLRQKMKRSAIACLIDEVDSKERSKLAEQRKILEMLRAASRGSETIRGTSDQKGTSFILRHLVWVAGIAIRYDDQADRNRAISFEVLPPLAEKRGKLTVPPRSELRDLGQRSLAVALYCALRARELAGRLRKHQIDGVDQRTIESFSVPVSMLKIANEGVWDISAEQLLTEMVAGISDASIAMAPDEVDLIGDILAGKVRMGQYQMTVAQAIEHIRNPANQNRDDWRKKLEEHGVKVALSRAVIAFAYPMVKRNLLVGTRWQDQAIDQYLRRIEGGTTKPIRCGALVNRGIEFELHAFIQEYMGEEDLSEGIVGSF